MVISHWVIINERGIFRDNVTLQNNGLTLTPALLYSGLQCSYPKFFKMDDLCKWAWIAAECLLAGNGALPPDADKNKIAVALTTGRGCLDVDKRYYESIAMPSPSLFVYTLPNIMLGELCIRHGFKGEQMCMVSENFDAGEMHFIVTELLKKGMDACLCGHIDVNAATQDICLFWISKSGNGPAFTPATLNGLYGAAPVK